jgi:hypothetical protein
MITENSSGFDFHGKKQQNVADGVLATDGVSKGQMDTAIQTAITTDISDNNIAFTGTNTHSGTETFSNAAGVTTDTITPRTSGAGTSLQAPVTPWLLNLSPAITASGSVFLANATTTTVANTITLPACTAGGVGTMFKVKVIKAVTAGGTYVVNTTGSDVFLGGVYGTIAAPNATNDALFAASTANKTLTLNATTTGGLIGGWLEFTMISATQWSVSGVTLGTGTIATPFSN